MRAAAAKRAASDVEALKALLLQFFAALPPGDPVVAAGRKGLAKLIF